MKSVVVAQSDEVATRVDAEAKILIRAMNLPGVDRLKSVQNAVSNLQEIISPLLVQNHRLLSPEMRFADFQKRFVQRIEDPRMPGFKTGFEWYDKYTLGPKSPELRVLGGRPGDGKSALTNQLANQIAALNEGFTGLLFTCEMSDPEIQDRTVAAYANVDKAWRKIKTGLYLEDGEREIILDAAQHLGNVPLWSCDLEGITVDGMREQIRYVEKEAGKLDGIFFDHLHHAGHPKDMSTHEAVSYNIREIKKICKEFGVFAYVAAQLSRPSNQRPSTEKPTLQDFRWSGDIEAVCDVAEFLWIPSTNERGGTNDDPQQPFREVIWGLLKNRSGMNRVEHTMIFSKPKTWFFEKGLQNG